MNVIEWNIKAVKQLKKLPKNFQTAIVKAVDGLAGFPDCQNVKRLTNHIHQYRLRVGRYRVFFNHTGQIVAIMEVKKRDERTY